MYMLTEEDKKKIKAFAKRMSLPDAIRAMTATNVDNKEVHKELKVAIIEIANIRTNELIKVLVDNDLRGI